MIAWKQSLPNYEWLVHQVWYLEVEQGEVIDPKPQLIPNPRAHLLFTPDDQPYSYDNGCVVLSGTGSHLLSINDDLLLLEDEAPLKRIGITFRPEGLYQLNPEAVALINQCDWYPWLAECFDEDFRESLWDAASDKDALCQLISRHLDSLNIMSSSNKASNAAAQVTAKFESNNAEEGAQHIDIEMLVKECACSRRTLERHFKQVVGLSLKSYQQMVRLEEMVLALYEQPDNIDWAAFSEEFGFTDQSHLIRTLKKQLKQTPSNYLKQRDLTIDIYGDFES